MRAGAYVRCHELMQRELLFGLALVLCACGDEAPATPNPPPPDAASDGSAPNDAGVPTDGAPTNPTYPVYAGCAAPATTFAADVFVDPGNGVDAPGRGGANAPYKTFAYLVTSKVLKGGEHVVLLAGDHGGLSLNEFNAPQLVGASAWTWFDFRPGAKASTIDFRKMSHLLVTGATVQSLKAGQDLVSVTSSSEVVIADNAVSSQATAPTTIQEWMGLSNGIDISNSHCASVLRNKLAWVRFGFTMSFAGLDYPANSARELVQDNQLDGFSGDGARMNASDLTIRGNAFRDGYASIADGDANHDDMIQGFKLDGGWFQNIVIEDNFLADRTSPNRKFVSEYQGIGIFDGVFKNLTIRRNVLLTGAYHGMGLYGVTDTTVENNTVISTSTKSLWIQVFVGKKGEQPSNVTVKNNLATKLFSTNVAVYANDYEVPNPAADFVQFDVANGAYDMHLKPTSAFFGKGAGAL